jgi:branched-chain amino acid transport system permease protein
VAISFGMLDIVNIAHPAFILLGSYVAFIGNTVFGIDPILATVITLPAFYVLGMLAYQVYYVAFERRDDQSLRGLSFFFGILFIAEVGLILAFGVDYRSVQAWYTTGNLNLGITELPWRLLVPFLLGLAMVVGLQLFLSRTFIGRAIQAVAQDQQALRLMAANPAKIKRIAFGLSFATAALGGAALIIIQPVEPSIGREYIGRIFAICVLGGLGSFPGMVIAAVTLGIVETITATFFGPSWAPAVSFGVLLITLAVRPSGILGR